MRDQSSGASLPGADAAGVHDGRRREHALDQLVAAHLQAEHGDGQVLVERRVLGDAQGQGGLAHARAGGDHDHVPGLEPADHAVEIGEPGRHAHQAVALLGGGEALEARDHQLVDAGEVAAHALLGELVHQGLGVLEHRGRLALALDDHPLDLLAHPQQAPLGGGVAHDLGVGAVAGRDEGRLHQVEHGHPPARVVQLAVLGQLLDDRDRLHRLAHVEQVLDRPVDRPVPLAVEVVRVEHALGLGDVAADLHEAGQQHGLRLAVLRRGDALGCHRVPLPRGAGAAQSSSGLTMVFTSVVRPGASSTGTE